MFDQYDIIVVGAGHAGCEAAAAAANMGSEVLLITMNMMNMAQMSCNPAMGGIAKGQIVREIDALGGYSGIITDRTMIQFRMLNRSKGPAMWSPRAQSDRMLFSLEWRKELEKIHSLHFWQDMVVSLIVEDGAVKGVSTKMGIDFFAKAVVLTNGTFLNGKIHIGKTNFEGGRIGEKSATGLTKVLIDLGFETSRMKTGTPVRIDGRTIDFSKIEEQRGDNEPGKFSFTDTPVLSRQRSCYITYTNKKVHDVLRLGFDDSPMFSGRIQGIGPRYCPSVEDKIDRFADKSRHQLFLEPEGWDTIEYYLNGFSSSLPLDIQIKALNQIEGLENAKIFRPGYAIEYDFFPPTQLNANLETKLVKNLFFAGQINGTTGYEEAAAQGIMAGINSHLSIHGKLPLILKRSDAYIGVLIDDLVTKGVDEPYRMFTSRAEYRIMLRQDNADIRLTPVAYKLGLAREERINALNHKLALIEKLNDFIENTKLLPGEVNEMLTEADTSPVNVKTTIKSLLLRPQITVNHLFKHLEPFRNFTEQICVGHHEILEQLEIQVKYHSYVNKEKEIADKINKLEDIEIPAGFEFRKLSSLSYEAREKLSKIHPRSIAQAARISGVSPADISVLLVYFGR